MWQAPQNGYQRGTRIIMSDTLNKLRLGAVIVFSFAVLNSDGSKDETAEIQNVNLSLDGVKDKDGNEIDPSLFATFEEVEDGVDKATITSDESLDGATGTFVATATVYWETPDGDEQVEREITALGTVTLSSDPSVGDTLEMTISLE